MDREGRDEPPRRQGMRTKFSVAMHLAVSAGLGALQLVRQSCDIGLHLLALVLYRKQPFVGRLQLRSQDGDLLWS